VSSILDRKRSSAPKGAGWLAPYRDTFLTELGRLGYAAKTIGDYQRAIDGFCAQVEARGLDAGEIGIELPAGQERKGCIARFIEHLIDAGVMAPPSPAVSPAPGSLDELSQAYGDWLHHDRGLSAKTISIRQSVLRRFLTFRFGTAPGDLNTSVSATIRAFTSSGQRRRLQPFASTSTLVGRPHCIPSSALVRSRPRSTTPRMPRPAILET